MKLKLLICIALSALLLCGCATDLPLESTEISANILSEPLENTNISKKDPIRFSEREMEDFIFEASCYETRDGETIRYQGEIHDQSICNGLWEIICMQEAMQIYEGGSCDSSTDLVLTDKATNEKYYVGYSIWYENPENEGGPKCFVVSGSNCGTVCYEAIEDTDDMVFVSDVYKNLLMQGVKTPENVIRETSVAENNEIENGNTEINMDLQARPVLARIRSNYAWGLQYEGTLIDSEGYIYSFDLSNRSDLLQSWGDEGKMLTHLYYNNMLMPVDTINKNTIEKIQSLGRKVAASANMNSDGFAYDMGQDSLYLFDEDSSELILLSSTGDNICQLQDKNAKKIVKLYNRIMGTNIGNRDFFAEMKEKLRY